MLYLDEYARLAAASKELLTVATHLEYFAYLWDSYYDWRLSEYLEMVWNEPGMPMETMCESCNVRPGYGMDCLCGVL